MEIRDFMTKENLEMIGLAVMCDRYAHFWRGYEVGSRGIQVIDAQYASTSFNNFMDMIHLGEDISIIMEFFETSNGEYRIKDVSKYLEEKGRGRSMQKITAVCRKLCASGYLKQRYSDPYKVTIKDFKLDWSSCPPKHKEVTKEIEVSDSLYSLA
jgi:hypothetical protein